MAKETVKKLTKDSDLWERYVFVYGYKYGEKFTLEDEYWENPSDPAFVEMRNSFCDQIEDRDDKDYLAGRWKAAIFDSVGEYVVIGTAFVLNSRPRGPCVAGPYVLHWGDQDEDVGAHENLHTPDVTYDHLEDWRWGQGAPLLAWREKKDGTHGYAALGSFSSSWWKGAAPPNVQTCEFTAQGVYVLYPYITKEINFQGVVFKPHVWKSPSAYLPGDREGIVILTTKGEVRCKNIPTVDILVGNVVWEVGHVLDETRFLRPRGKSPQLETYLFKYVALPYVELPKKEYEIVYREVGPIRPTVFEGGKLVIESGCRTGAVSRVVNGDIVRYTSGSHTIMGHRDAPPPSLYMFSVAQTSRFGVKAFFLKEGKPILFKDGTKKWDFIGGKIDPRDSSTKAALLREIKEETGVSYSGKLCPLGLIIGPEWSTYLYMIEEFTPLKGVFAVWDENKETVPWMPAMVDHYMKYKKDPIVTRPHTEMTLTIQGMCVLNQVVEEEKKGTGCHLSIMKNTLIVGQVQSAHVLYAFRFFLKHRPHDRSDMVQQLRSEYRVEGIKPPDPYQIQRVISTLEGYITQGEPTYLIQVKVGCDRALLDKLF